MENSTAKTQRQKGDSYGKKQGPQSGGIGLSLQQKQSPTGAN
ncbi:MULTISPECIES: hypothetical protein [Aeromonas]|nr:hypothetical protein [Aeromonas hydrophila]